MSRLLTQLLLGARLSIAGGRRGWVRIGTVALGIALGVAVLLLAAAVPTILAERHERTGPRFDAFFAPESSATDATVLVGTVELTWRGKAVRGRLLRPDGPRAPLPPGVSAFPADGTMLVSPALRAALRGPDGAELRAQVPYEVTGTVADRGLADPREYVFYAGDDKLHDVPGPQVQRLTGFGAPGGGGIDPGLRMLAVLAVLTLLLPVALFVGAAIRFSGDSRDRRLAAIRLAGADRAAAVRIAIGEALVPALLGLAGGTVLFAVVREFVPHIEVLDTSAFTADVRPAPLLALLVLIGVLAMTVAVTLLMLRTVVIEPLGVVRRTRPRRARLWWRLVLPVVGVVLAYPALRGVRYQPGNSEERQILVAVMVLLVAVVPLVPYAVPAVVRLLGRGPLAWQLAVRQLRQNPAASSRAVTGLAVGVAGAIALQLLFAGAEVSRTAPDAGLAGGGPPFLAEQNFGVTVAARARAQQAYRAIPGMRASSVLLVPLLTDTTPTGPSALVVGDCTALRVVATLDRCADGDSFVVGDRPGTVSIDDGTGRSAGRWRVPSGARPVTRTEALGDPLYPTLFATPAAAPRIPPDVARLRTYFTTGLDDDAAFARIRAVSMRLDPLTTVVNTTRLQHADPFAAVRTGLLIGTVVVLILMCLSLLLDAADRLRERRRLLGVLAAIGARPVTLVWSMVWQSLIPLLVGLTLAGLAGIVLGFALQRAEQLPLHLDAAAILVPVAVAAALAVLTTLVSLPAVRALMSTEELRHE
ncbi:FtsX-like permease family protein [Actinoplanes sp. N902-109]|uniref:FtsX-like permease family protein n=1 Tax=Actinoplanes sp. (strain N902-109) TaxID=649831 RepID=UPI00032935E1|nr:FtsX-like permease family protein [Actinoplanes sp. N902-109]AGL19057.1 integral membrane protein [Actinoplanes sp. N902-109]